MTMNCFGGMHRTMRMLLPYCCFPTCCQVKDIKESYVQKVTAYVEEHHTTGDTLKRQIREGILQQVGWVGWVGVM